MDELIDFENLTADDIREEYMNLWKRLKEYQGRAEEDAQKIYSLKRQLDTAISAQAELEAEIEQLSSNCASDATNAELKQLRIEYDELKHLYNTSEAEILTVQQEKEVLQEENTRLLNEVVDLKNNAKLAGSPTKNENTMDRLSALENDNMELLEKMQELLEQDNQKTMFVASLEKNLEMMQEQVNCLKENLRSKSEEAEEKTNLLECAQEQVAELNGKIAMFTSAPDNENRKGNSLFAEVDDQRQAMRKVLEAQKKHYLQMKKSFNESEYEIRRLKRENSAMHTEMQTVSGIFCNADKTYHNKLNEHLRMLNHRNDELERKIKYLEDGLKAVAQERGLTWLDSMLKFCKSENNDLKDELRKMRLQQSSLEEQLRNMQQDMARWRFETLRLRCVLIDRETLLNDNKIPFKAIKNFEFHVTEEDVAKARPRVAAPAKRQSLTLTPVTHKVSNTTAQPSNEKKSLKESKKSDDDSVVCLEESLKSIDLDDKEDACLPQTRFSTKILNSPRIKTTAKKVSTEVIEDKENLCPLKANNGDSIEPGKSSEIKDSIIIFDDNKSSEVAASKLETSPGINSILSKGRDVFASNQVEKNVQFSNQNTFFSPPKKDKPDSSVVESKTGIKSSNTTQSLDVKSNVSTTRNNSSGVIIRRCVFESKLLPKKES